MQKNREQRKAMNQAVYKELFKIENQLDYKGIYNQFKGRYKERALAIKK